MPKLTTSGPPSTPDGAPVNAWDAQFGDQTVNIVEFKVDLDHTPFLAGLPDDRCQCPHWGYIIEGRVTFRYADHDETYEAGEAFHAPAGHVPITNEPGTRYVQFSPAAELAKTDEAIMRNMAALMAS